MEKLHRYGMRLRGYSMGTQPRGVVEWEDADKSKDGYWSYIYYNEKLTQRQMEDYDLDYLGESSDK